MSTKIFVHRQLKIKPPKAPDPNLDKLFEAQAEERRRREVKQAEDRRIMAQLRAEELEKRAARMPKTEAKAKEWCCAYCWGSEKAEKLFDRKTLKFIVSAVGKNHLERLEDPWRKKAEVSLAAALEKTAKAHGIALTDEQLLKISVRAVYRTIKLCKDELPKMRAADRIEAGQRTPKPLLY